MKFEETTSSYCSHHNACWWPGTVCFWDICRCGDDQVEYSVEYSFEREMFMSWCSLNADVIPQMHFVEWSYVNLDQNFSEFVLKGPIDNEPASVQLIAWHQTGKKPLQGPMVTKMHDIMVSLGHSEFSDNISIYNRNFTDNKLGAISV